MLGQFPCDLHAIEYGHSEIQDNQIWSNADLPSAAVATTSNSIASNEVSFCRNAGLSSATIMRVLAKGIPLLWGASARQEHDLCHTTENREEP
jgi:hypothetical protein